jgi:hypothetical protein
MVEGILDWAWLSAFEIWVAIALPYFTSWVQKIEQGVRHAFCGPLAILAHPHEGGPVPGAEQGKNHKRSEAKAAV